MGVLWQLVVSRRYGRSKCAPEKEKKERDWTRKPLLRRGKSTWISPRGTLCGVVSLPRFGFCFCFIVVVPVFIDLLRSTCSSLDVIG